MTQNVQEIRLNTIPRSCDVQQEHLETTNIHQGSL